VAAEISLSGTGCNGRSFDKHPGIGSLDEPSRRPVEHVQRGVAGLSFADNDDNGREPRARGTELVAVGYPEKRGVSVPKDQ
jgi:hypothetical protein